MDAALVIEERYHEVELSELPAVGHLAVFARRPVWRESVFDAVLEKGASELRTVIIRLTHG